mmetsp:Transcript_63105/g.163758  ORF Transcript_63105/g.163758 Transcript_63105/m.163758 type:complete len:264 (-) Transcript_63105:726-1517(-)
MPSQLQSERFPPSTCTDLHLEFVHCDRVRSDLDMSTSRNEASDARASQKSAPEATTSSQDDWLSLARRALQPLSLTRLRQAPSRSALLRSTSDKSLSSSNARLKLACVSCAPDSLTLRNSAPSRLAPPRTAPASSTRSSFAPTSRARLRTGFCPLQSVSEASLKFAPQSDVELRDTSCSELCDQSAPPRSASLSETLSSRVRRKSLSPRRAPVALRSAKVAPWQREPSRFASCKLVPLSCTSSMQAASASRSLMSAWSSTAPL